MIRKTCDFEAFRTPPAGFEPATCGLEVPANQVFLGSYGESTWSELAELTTLVLSWRGRSGRGPTLAARRPRAPVGRGA